MTEHIQIINRTRRVRDARFQAALPGLQQQISGDFAPIWGADALLTLVNRYQNPDPTAWKLWLYDTSDDAGALGYHEDGSGIPESKIFVEDDIRYGAEITVSASHELLEMLADPLTTRISEAMPDGKRYAIEVCDPVEADTLGYMIGGIRVSDFVTPRYFGLQSAVAGGGFDFCRHLAGPVPEITGGGYLLYVDASSKWRSTMERYEDGSLSVRAIRSEGRTARRASRPA